MQENAKECICVGGQAKLSQHLKYSNVLFKILSFLCLVFYKVTLSYVSSAVSRIIIEYVCCSTAAVSKY